MKPKKLGRGLESLLPGYARKKITTPAPSFSLSPSEIPSKAISFPTGLSEAAVPIKTESVPTPTPLPPMPTSFSEQSEKGLIYVPVNEISPNRFQPRKDFDQESLNELIESIKSAGVLQPVIVRKSGNGYELVAGERRWRACKTLRIAQIPAIIKEIDDKAALEWALIENVQRRDLNPIERGRAFKELASTFQLTHDQVAVRVGLNRATITNFIRLLDLPAEIQEDVSRGTISMGHARALLGVTDRNLLFQLARQIKSAGLSVRQLENMIAARSRKAPVKSKATSEKDLYLKELEERLRRKFGTKVAITSYNKRGYIQIEFYSNDDFQRILEIIGT